MGMAYQKVGSTVVDQKRKRDRKAMADAPTIPVPQDLTTINPAIAEGETSVFDGSGQDAVRRRQRARQKPTRGANPFVRGVRTAG